MIFSRKHKHSLSGFTLVEIMVALVIFGLVMAGIAKMFISTAKYNTIQEMTMTMVQDVRAAKHLMTMDIREAGCNPLEVSGIGFQLDAGDERFDTDDDSIHFTMDRDNGDGGQFLEPDGDTLDNNEDVAYYRTLTGNPTIVLASGDTTAGTLRRSTAGGVGEAVADNITRLAFTYYNSAGAPILTTNSQASLDLIRTVEVEIVGQLQNPNIVDVDHQTWTQTLRIRVRNATM